jgi:TolB-like protein
MCRTTFARVGCTMFGVLLPTAVALAADPVASQPAPPPTTMTTPPADDRATGVVVLPLETVGGGNAESVGELARAIEKSIAQDLSRSRQFRVTQGGAVPANRDATVASGKSAGADYAISGTIQESDGRVRVTGEVLDIAKAEPAGSFKVTSDTRDVFELQDQVAARVRLHLMRSVALSRDSQGDDAADTQPAEVPASEPLRARVRSIDPDWLTPPDNPGDPNADAMAYRYNYADPYAYWSSPYWSIPYGYGNYYGLGYSPGRFSYGLGYGYGGYHYSYYRPWRPLYQHRFYDYSYRGMYDRRTYDGFGPRILHNFSGPVPMRNYNAPMQRNYNAPMQRNYNAPTMRNFNGPVPTRSTR